MWLVFRYALAAVRAVARERRELALENIALRHHIEVLTRNRRRPQLQPADRLLWSSLSRMWPSWRRHIVIVQPDTVVRWHRTVWRRYWRWKSRGGRRGRPRIEPELAELIRRMTQENPRWGHMRVLGELHKLGFRVSLLAVRSLSERTSRATRCRAGARSSRTTARRSGHRTSSRCTRSGSTRSTSSSSSRTIAAR